MNDMKRIQYEFSGNIISAVIKLHLISKLTERDNIILAVLQSGIDIIDMIRAYYHAHDTRMVDILLDIIDGGDEDLKKILEMDEDND